MKKAIIFFLSEFIMFGFALGVVLLMYPGIPWSIAFTVAFMIYLFSSIISFVIDSLLRWAVDKYYARKESKHE